MQLPVHPPEVDLQAPLHTILPFEFLADADHNPSKQVIVRDDATVTAVDGPIIEPNRRAAMIE